MASPAGVGALRLIRTKVTTAYQEILELFLLPPADHLRGGPSNSPAGPDAWFDVSPC